MKSIGYVDKKYGSDLAERWIDRVARKLLIGVFNKMTRGHLTIEENGRVMTFGETQAQAQVTAHVSVAHPSFYRYVLFGGTVGSGEAYMVKAWTSPDLVQVIRVMVLNLAVLKTMDTGLHRFNRLIGSWLHRLNQNSKEGSRRNIAAHYDLSNDFFSLFLDATMMYSSAIYPHAKASLLEASTHKLHHVCTQLHLQASDHLLEIGTGWGGLAIYAAQNFGCKVTSITISQAQYDFATDRVAELGLTDQVSIRLCDYRDLQGNFDKLVSIEMIEAVGYEFYGSYFAQCSSLLKSDGLMLIQAITIPHNRFELGRHKMDFIRRYIFPGGCLPSTLEITKNIAQHTDLELINFDDITQHYARTLRDWKSQFFANIDQIKALGFDDVFIRMWDYYLSYCEGGFTERVIGTAQLTFAKPGYRKRANHGEYHG